MAFVTKLVPLFFLTTLLAQSSSLSELWKQNKWEEWISLAASQGLKSPEAHFNRASQAWSAEDPPTAIKHLLISSQLRSNPIKAWSDLSWISQIQSVLFSQPSPIDSYRMRLALIWTPHLQILWGCSLFWLLLLAIFFRWGRPSFNHWNRFLMILLAFEVLSGGLLFFNKRNLSLPSYLAQSEKLIPIFKDSDTKSEEPILELPSGVLLVTGETRNERVLILEPLKAWVDERFVATYPTLN